MLTRDELARYDRQIMLYGFGEEGQEKLKKSKVFIGGAGGLGSPVAMYLTAAGIGQIKIADNDRVDLSNLNRQILHWEEDIGKKKVDSARNKLLKLNPSLKLEISDDTISEDNVLQMVEGADVGILIESETVPYFPEVKKLAETGMIPGGLHRNQDFRKHMVDIEKSVPKFLQDILYDPQTSGGLLIAVPDKKAPVLLEKLHEAGVSEAVIIGEVVAENRGRIRVR